MLLRLAMFVLQRFLQNIRKFVGMYAITRFCALLYETCNFFMHCWRLFHVHQDLCFKPPPPRISKLPAGWTLICTKVSVLGYADDLVLVVPTTLAVQFLLNALTSKLYTLSLQVNMQKSCDIDFRHSNKKVLISLTMNNQPLRQVMETTHLGVVLTDDLSSAKDVVRAKLAFVKQFSSMYHKIRFVDKNELLHLFRLHAMSFYGAETWYINLNKKDLKKHFCPVS